MKKIILAGSMILALAAGSVFAAQGNKNTKSTGKSSTTMASNTGGTKTGGKSHRRHHRKHHKGGSKSTGDTGAAKGNSNKKK